MFAPTQVDAAFEVDERLCLHADLRVSVRHTFHRG